MQFQLSRSHEVYQCVLRAFDAGANGIVVSRDYEEMRINNLKAVGRAVREVTRRTAARG